MCNHKEFYKQLTAEQFFKIFPPETRCIGIFSNGTYQHVANLGTEVVCDFCNNDVYDEEHKVGYGLFVDDNPRPYDIICERCYKNHE